MDLDYTKKVEQIAAWVKSTLHETGFHDVVIALSGGIDSALTTTLAVKALGKEHVHVLLLPYGELSKKSTEDARIVTSFLALPEENIQEIDIKDSVDCLWGPAARQVHACQASDLLRPVQNLLPSSASWSDSVQKSSGAPRSRVTPSELDAIRQGNIMARVRMIYLYDFAKANNCLVVGTENKSEYYLGYFTRFGDEASDIEPIRSLYKTQVQGMAQFLGIPKEIIGKAPSAGLWESQTDEKEFGFTYRDADRVLYHHFDEGLPEEAIVDLGIPQEIVKKVLEWVAKNDFKHKLPYILNNT